jgi:histidine ammonia-lyase
LAALSELPAFLVKEGGLNSGFMIAHCTAASLGQCQTEASSSEANYSVNNGMNKNNQD